jgi:hypothetical protein
LAPLFLMLFTGLYMFALPYSAKWRPQSSLRRFGTEKEESA